VTSELGPIEVVGLKQALAELNKIDKKLRRSITTDFKKIVDPVLEEARNKLPDKAPLSGMARSWTGNSGAELMHWEPKKVNKNLKAFTSGKKVREAPGGFKQNLATFGIRWGGPQATLFDMARKGAMSQQLQARFGSPSRVIWRAYKAQEAEVSDQVRDLVNRVMKMTGNNGRI
jgi:hypothetical protein